MTCATQQSTLTTTNAAAHQIAHTTDAAQLATIVCAACAPLCAAAIVCATPAQRQMIAQADALKNEDAFSTDTTPSAESTLGLHRRNDGFGVEGTEHVDDCSIGTDDADCFTDDDEQPPLERTDTFTAYNENAALEWSDPRPPLQQWPAPVVLPTIFLPPPVESTDIAGATIGSLDLLQGPARKELMKLRKKLREIERIQEHLDIGEMIDHLQMAKLETRGEVIAQIERVGGASGIDGATPPCHFVQQDYRATASVPEDFASRCETSASAANVQIAADGTTGFEQALVAQADWYTFLCHAPVELVHNDTSDVRVGISPRDERADSAQAIFNIVEQAQLQAEARAAHEASLLPRRRRGTKCIDGMSRVSFKAHAHVLAQGLDAGGEAQAEVLASMPRIAFELAMDAVGCRVLQDALEISDLSTAAQLAAGLQGHVRELINSPHGNYVIQKVVEVLPVAQASFVAQELIGHGTSIARHRFGCRIMCRLLEHSAGEKRGDDALNTLVQEVTEATIDLSHHNFGHHVVQSVIEHGSPTQRDDVIWKVARDLPRSLRSRSASFVIEKILIDCCSDERRVILERLAAGGSEMRDALARSGRSGARINRLLKSYLGEYASHTSEATPPASQHNE